MNQNHTRTSTDDIIDFILWNADISFMPLPTLIKL